MAPRSLTAVLLWAAAVLVVSGLPTQPRAAAETGDERTSRVSDLSGGTPSSGRQEQGSQLGHPRLYFTSAELPSLRERARTTHAAIWAELQSYCESHLGDTPPAALPGEDYNDKGMYLEREFLTRITNFSLAYAVGGDRRCLAAAKSWLLALTRMPEWEGRAGNRVDVGLYAGFGEIALAIGLDWLYSSLTPGERSEITAKLAVIARGICDATYEGEWWTGSYWHHDLIIPVAGLGVAALALDGETPEAAHWLERAIAETETTLDRIGDDGAWHEGAAPWAIGTMPMLMFLDPLERETGRAFWSHPWLRATAGYRVYAWLPPDNVVNFDDSHISGGYLDLTRDCAPILYRLARQYKDSHAQWLADLNAASKKNPHSIAWRFLWRDVAVEPKGPEDLPLARLFPNQDLLVSRAGWGRADPVVAFTCGATIGRRGLQFAVNEDGSYNVGANVGTSHTHADQLSFLVYADGDYLISPQGYGLRDAGEENCILIDGLGPRRYERVTEPLSGPGQITSSSFTPGLDMVTGEAATCYPKALGVAQATRRLVFAKPDTILLSDTIAIGAEREVEWRFHAGYGVGIHVMEDGSFLFQGRQASLQFTLLAPRDLTALVERDQRHMWLRFRWPRRTEAATMRALMHITTTSSGIR